MDEEQRLAFQTALSARNFEIDLFWRRSNYFLLLNAALVAGVASRSGSVGLILGFSLTGFLVSTIWTRAVLGSKYWQERWESRLHRIEAQYMSDADLFDVPRVVQDQEVRESLSSGVTQGTASRTLGRAFRKWIDRRILARPSVSRSAIYLSFTFVGFWLVALIFAVYAFAKGRVAPLFTSSEFDMAALIEGLNGATFLAVAFSGASAVCTVALAIVAYLNLRAFRKSLQDAQRPVVVLRFRDQGCRLSYRLVNAGSGPALRLQLTVPEDLPDDLKSLLEDPMPSDDALPPETGDHNLQIAFASSAADKRLLRDKRFALTVEYEDLFHRRYKTVFRDCQHHVEGPM
jgi:hypothetical protein